MKCIHRYFKMILIYNDFKFYFIAYAKKYAEDNEWDVQNSQLIKTSIRTLLQELKAANDAASKAEEKKCV